MPSRPDPNSKSVEFADGALPERSGSLSASDPASPGGPLTLPAGADRDREPATTRPDALLVIARWLDRRRFWVAALILIVYAAGFTGQWRSGSDSAEALTVGRSVAQGDGFKHPATYRPSMAPGLPLVAAASFQGDTPTENSPKSVGPVLLLVTACALGCLGIFFALVRDAAGRPTAVLLTGMLAFSDTFYRYHLEALADLPFLMGLLGAFWALQRLESRATRLEVAPTASEPSLATAAKGTTPRPAAGIGFAGLVMVLAVSLVWMVAFRNVALVWLIALAVYGLGRMAFGPDRKPWSILLTIVALVGAGARWIMPGGGLVGGDEAWAWRRMTSFVQDTLHRGFTENLPELLTETIAEASIGVDLGPIASVPIAALVVFGVVLLARYRPLWALVAIVFAVQWIVFIVELRYALATLPVWLIGWWMLMRRAEARLPGRWGTNAALVLLGLWFFPNAAHVVGRIIDQRCADPMAHFEDGRYSELNLLAEPIRTHVTPKDLILADDGYEITWLTGRVALTPAELRDRGTFRPITLQRLYRDADQLWIVAPVTPVMQEKLDRLWLTPGPAVASSSGEIGQTLTLHRAVWTDEARVRQAVRHLEQKNGE